MSNNTLDFSGKVALVTGAASGMGLATAKAFAEVGIREDIQEPVGQMNAGKTA